jgi:hypothetical protein
MLYAINNSKRRLFLLANILLIIIANLHPFKPKITKLILQLSRHYLLQLVHRYRYFHNLLPPSPILPHQNELRRCRLRHAGSPHHNNRYIYLLHPIHQTKNIHRYRSLTFVYILRINHL